MVMREPREQPGGLFDAVLGALGRAAQDVRSKLIDEGWFGRRTGMAAQPDLGRDWRGPTIHDGPGLSMSRPSFEEQWAPRGQDEAQASEPGGMDIDR